MRKYYVYAWLREDGTPYYIGKGCDKRAWRKHGEGYAQRPADKSRIVLLHENLNEEEALDKERDIIAHYGRKVKGGILHNQSEGGDNPPKNTGHSEETKRKIKESNIRTKAKGISEETRRKMSESAKRRANSPEGREMLRQNGATTSSSLARGKDGRFSDRQKHS